MDYSANVGQRAAEERSAAERVIRGTGWVLWQGVRWPVLTLLITLEPVARVVLGSLALLGTLTAFFFAALHVRHFPFWGMLGFSLGCAALLILYYGLIRLFSPRW